MVIPPHAGVTQPVVLQEERYANEHDGNTQRTPRADRRCNKTTEDVCSLIVSFFQSAFACSQKRCNLYRALCPTTSLDAVMSQPTTATTTATIITITTTTTTKPGATATGSVFPVPPQPNCTNIHLRSHSEPASCRHREERIQMVMERDPESVRGRRIGRDGERERERERA